MNWRDDVRLEAAASAAEPAAATTLLEGMACRRPVVATRSPGLSDYLDPADGPSIVEPSDAEGLRAAIVRLLEDPDEARARAEAGYRRIAQRHGFDRSIDGLARIIGSL